MDDLKLIKKHYGEQMSHLCRELFPTLLEKEGFLHSLIEDKFAHNKFLYNDIVEQNKINEFKNLIYDKADIKIQESESSSKTPQELMDEAGYILYECKTEEDVKQFEKYFEKNERLCTFCDITGRLNKCHVFFAVKKNVDEIKRENFRNPERQDEYGTSVISIQFTRGSTNTLSIKNRYNHTVSNPDATFSNNLDNIIPGLTNSFAKKYSLNINSNTKNGFYLDGYILANDGKYYKYNLEVNNVYFCPDNVIINCCNPHKYNPSEWLVIDNILIDLKFKSIDSDFMTDDVFSFNKSLGEIEKIKIINEKKKKKIIINDDIIIEVNSANQIISYSNPHVTKIESNFLSFNQTIESLELPNVMYIGNNFLLRNKNLKKLSLPNARVIYDTFMAGSALEEIDLPKVKSIDHSFLMYDRNIKAINAPSLKTILNNFLRCSEIKELELPNVVEIGNGFLEQNGYVEKISLPNVETIGNEFISYINGNITSIYLPKVKEIGAYFLANKHKIKHVELPSVEKIGNCFMTCTNVQSLVLPNVKEIGDYFVFKNDSLTELTLPNVEKIGDDFLYRTEIKKLDLPKVKEIGNGFCCGLHDNDFDVTIRNKIKTLSLPSVDIIGDHFMSYSEIEELDVPKLRWIGRSFLSHSQNIRVINMPIIESIGKAFLYRVKGNVNNKKEPKLKNANISFIDKKNDPAHISILTEVVIGKDFCCDNESIRIIDMPRAIILEKGFFKSNNNIEEATLSKDNCELEIMHLNVKKYLKEV